MEVRWCLTQCHEASGRARTWHKTDVSGSPSDKPGLIACSVLFPQQSFCAW